MPNSKQIFDHIKRMSILVPPSPKPNGLYDMVTVVDNMAYTSGQLSRQDNDGNLIAGHIGPDEDMSKAVEAAQICFIRGLVALHEQLGDLEKIKKVVFIRGFINAQHSFSRHSEVLNYVSQLAIDLFGEKIGRHSRSALGAGSLPSNGLVEIELVVQLNEM